MGIFGGSSVATRQSNNLSDPLAHYYEVAFNAYNTLIWEGTKYADDDLELESLAYYRALTCFYGSDMIDISDRRRLLYAFMVTEFKTGRGTDTLERYKNTLPIQSSVRRVLNNLCIAYNQPPKRRFSNTPSMDDTFKNLYTEAKISNVLARIYRLAKLCSWVLVRPVWIDGKLQLNYLSPSQCRVEVSDTNNKVITEVAYPDYDADNNVLAIRHWTPFEVWTTNTKGNIIEKKPLVNPYGVIPYVAMKLELGTRYYTGGMFELIEDQLERNKFRFLSNADVSFNGRPIKIAINMGKGELIFSPDQVLALDGVVNESSGGGYARPALELVSPDPQYTMIDDFASSREQIAMRTEGLPESMINNTGTPLSGIAKIIDRQELIEKRNADLPLLAEFEKNLAKMVALIGKVDANLNLDMEMKDFSIDFEEDKVYIEPDAEYEFDKKKLQDGLIDPLEFMKKWGGFDNEITKESAIKVVTERKELVKLLGFTPSIAEQTLGITTIGTAPVNPLQQGIDTQQSNSIDNQKSINNFQQQQQV
jgi:hypothetical protein